MSYSALQPLQLYFLRQKTTCQLSRPRGSRRRLAITLSPAPCKLYGNSCPNPSIMCLSDEHCWYKKNLKLQQPQEPCGNGLNHAGTTPIIRLRHGQSMFTGFLAYWHLRKGKERPLAVAEILLGRSRKFILRGAAKVRACSAYGAVAAALHCQQATSP